MTISVGARMGVRISNGIAIGPSIGVQLAGRAGDVFVGPYDDIPNIAALYALRRGLTAYTGPLIRLRRSSDNAEDDFGWLPNGDLEVAAIAAWLGEDDGYVTTWYDQSGNGRNATQGTASMQPAYIASGQNGKPVLRFNGSHAIRVPQTAVALIGSLLIRFSNYTSGYLSGIWSTVSGGPGTFTFVPNSSGQMVFGHGGRTDNSHPAVTEGVVATAAGNFYYNGDLVSAGEMTSSTPVQALDIGARRRVDNQEMSNFAISDIHEIAISLTTYAAQEISDITTIMQGA